MGRRDVFAGHWGNSRGQSVYKKKSSFWAKVDGKTYRLMLFTKSRGYQPGVKDFVVGPEWKQFTFRSSEFDGMDGSDLMGILFAGGPTPGKFTFPD